VRRDRVADCFELRRFADVDDETGKLEGVLELRQRGGEGSARVGAGHREQRAARGQERKTFGGCQPQRALEVVGEMDRDVTGVVLLDVEIVAGRIRRVRDRRRVVRR
jgi:hypothetical protein